MRIPLFMIVLVGFGCMLQTIEVSGQTKYEREYRINIREVPEKARAFIESIPIGQKVKWYYEENLVGNSVESKFMFRNRKHSVEFDTAGNLQDIEIAIRWRDIPEKQRLVMETELDSVYDKYRIREVQIQYTGDAQMLLKMLKDQDAGAEYVTKYEIVIKGRKEKETHLYEIHFNDKGRMEDISRIVYKNTDNLEF